MHAGGLYMAELTLEQRVAALEQAVASLQQGPTA
jgi:hypothetical protein